MANYQRDKHAGTKIFIKTELRKLRIKDIDWGDASDPTSTYNCFGYAVGVLKWWQRKKFMGGKNVTPNHHWPDGLPDDYLIDSYVAAARFLGFRECSRAEWDAANDHKIVLYEKNGEFTHAVKFISKTVWKSKLGDFSDIAHAPNAVDSDYYGLPTRYMVKDPIHFTCAS